MPSTAGSRTCRCTRGRTAGRACRSGSTRPRRRLSSSVIPAPADSIVAIDRQGPTGIARKRPATLVIDKAVYGALVQEGEGWVDVTSKVKALAASGTRRIPATNDMAGTDPANQIVKELCVDLIVAGCQERLTAPENETLELPPGAEVVRALYGDIPPDAELKDRVVDVTGKLASLVQDGTLSVVATNELAGRDPAFLTVKKLRVEYTLNGAHRSVTVGENQPLTLPVEEASVATLPTHALTATAEGLQLEAWAEGAFTFRTASGRVSRLNVPAPPPPLEIKGPWTLHFQPGRGAPEAIRLETLGSWTDHPEPGVKYFSGSATYTRSIEIPADRLEAGRASVPRPGPSDRLRRAGPQRQASGRALETAVPRRTDGSGTTGPERSLDPRHQPLAESPDRRRAAPRGRRVGRHPPCFLAPLAS